MPRKEGLRPMGDSIKKIIEKIRAEREARRGNKPIRTQPKIPGLKKGGPVRPINIPWPKPGSPVPPKKDKKAEGGEMKKRRKSKGPGHPRQQQPALPKKPGSPTQTPRDIGRLGPQSKDSKGAGPYGEKPPQLKKSKKERREKYRKEVQKHGGNVIYADEWDKIDPGLKKAIGLKKGGVKKAFLGKLMDKLRGKGKRTGRAEPFRSELYKKQSKPTHKQTMDIMKQKMGMKKGGVKKAFGGQLMGQPTGTPQGALAGQQRPQPTAQPTADQTLNVMQQNVRQKLGMKKGGKSSGPKPGSLEYWQMVTQKPKRNAHGGITGKSTVGQLRKKYGPLKKGIRLKGTGSSFMKEYKKRVYGRAKGGSMVQGPMKRARGSGAAIKGTRFQGTF